MPHRRWSGPSCGRARWTLGAPLRAGAPTLHSGVEARLFLLNLYCSYYLRTVGPAERHAAWNGSEMSQTRTAEIAGAGLAGMTAAAVLAQRGWKVRVHEKGPALREI